MQSSDGRTILDEKSRRIHWPKSLRSYLHLRNLRATISSSDPRDKPRPRLAAALQADQEQALGNSSRLVYYLVSLDGGGRLIELVQQAREQVDDELVRKLVQTHDPDNSAGSNKSDSAFYRRLSRLSDVEGANSALPHRLQRRGSSHMSNLRRRFRKVVDFRRVIASTGGYAEAVAQMEGRPYEEVVASHEIFVRCMREALRERLPASLVARFRDPMQKRGSLAERSS